MAIDKIMAISEKRAATPPAVRLGLFRFFALEHRHTGRFCLAAVSFPPPADADTIIIVFQRGECFNAHRAGVRVRVIRAEDT